MYQFSRPLPAAVAAVLAAALLWIADADAHKGGIIIQADGSKLVTGFDNEVVGTQTIGDRAFSLVFPSILVTDVPSFLSFTNPPAGSDALPVGGVLHWDFLPMSNGEIVSDLLYWDGVGDSVEDVSFGGLPQEDISLSVWTRSLDRAMVTGSPVMTPGKVIGTVTASGTSLHAHPFYSMEPETSVPEGVYLFALQVRLEGYEHTDPFYVVAGTDEISPSTLDTIALPWVAERVDQLVLPGDYDFSGDVAAGDFLAWQRHFGSTGPFPLDGTYPDGSRNDVVDADDLTVWQQHYGATATALPPSVTAIPEPETLSIALLFGLACRARR